MKKPIWTFCKREKNTQHKREARHGKRTGKVALVENSARHHTCHSLFLSLDLPFLSLSLSLLATLFRPLSPSSSSSLPQTILRFSMAATFAFNAVGAQAKLSAHFSHLRRPSPLLSGLRSPPLLPGLSRQRTKSASFSSSGKATFFVLRVLNSLIPPIDWLA